MVTATSRIAVDLAARDTPLCTPVTPSKNPAYGAGDRRTTRPGSVPALCATPGAPASGW